MARIKAVSDRVGIAKTTPRSFHGAAIITNDGEEIEITEAMVQEACAELENAWLFPRLGNQQTPNIRLV